MPLLMHLTDRLRFFLICFAALTVSLPMAWVSLGKLVLFVTCLGFLGRQLLRNEHDGALDALWSVRVILLVVAAFALSLCWSEAPLDIALPAFVKHGKLLEIAMLVSLIRTRPEARQVMLVFLLSQAIFILTSWAMVAGLPIPWATSQHDVMPTYRYIVFSTYLDQTLIFSATAAVFWHLRAEWQCWRRAAALLAAAALVNTLFLQEGRTGYAAALTVLTLAIMWELPKRMRLAALLLTPLLLLTVLYEGSAQVQDRITQAINESQSYRDQGSSDSSSGFRLHAWHRSVQAMLENPLTGTGVGSWTLTVERLEGADADKVFGTNLSSNPHQEYLMWGVELGSGGLLLLSLLIFCLLRDALTFELPVMRATVSVVLVMAVACLFNASLYDALIGDFFCITLGLLLALGVRRDNQASTGAQPPPVGVTA